MTRLAAPLRLNGPSLMASLARRRLWARRSILCHRAIASNIFSARTLACAGFALLLAMTAGAGWGPAPDDLEGLNRQVVARLNDLALLYPAQGQ
jgi:hypothetical protein